MNVFRLLMTMLVYFSTLPLFVAAFVQFASMRVIGEKMHPGICFFIGFVLTMKILAKLLAKGYVPVNGNNIRRSYDHVFKPKNSSGQSKYCWLRSGWNFIWFWHKLDAEILNVENAPPVDFSGNIMTRQGEIRLVSAKLSYAVNAESDSSLDAHVASGKDDKERKSSTAGRLKDKVFEILAESLIDKSATEVVGQKKNFIANNITKIFASTEKLDDELGVRIVGVEIGNIDLPVALDELNQVDQKTAKYEKTLEQLRKSMAGCPDEMIVGTALVMNGEPEAGKAALLAASKKIIGVGSSDGGGPV